MNDTRVYTYGGAVAHLLDELLSPNECNAARCGRMPGWPDLWHGTGNQDEIEKAADLPLCSPCAGALERLRNGTERT